MVQTPMLVLAFVLAGFSALAASAQGTPVPPPAPAPEAAVAAPDPMVFAPIAAQDTDLNEFVWKKRPIVVFANTPEDPAFIEQMRLLAARWPELAARDVVVITDTAPVPISPVRRALRPRGFALVIVEKDGSVALRKPLPWDGREIMRAIDKMPIRRDEIRNQSLGLAPDAIAGPETGTGSAIGG
ncbi:DUF4174 domain-containing protein [Pontitalea aquivivens]|uniref:DUF4174 domain-containing protein n=1 Tax=Pontitalea aquivivens TaxID=3388663 RepID=UPI003970AF6A